MMRVLRDLVSQLVVSTSSDLDGGLEPSDVYDLLDVSESGSRNEHLANPLNRRPDVFYFSPRKQSLSGNEPVYGRFLAFKYVGHYPQLFLFDYDDVESLEVAIISPSGILNAFTTFFVPFVDFVATPYKVAYWDGTEVVEFDKRAQYESGKPFSNEYPDPVVEWISSRSG